MKMHGLTNPKGAEQFAYHRKKTRHSDNF